MFASAAQDVFLVPQQFATIQAAINAVVAPTSIVVQPGLYEESIYVSAKEAVIIQSARLSRRGVTISGSGGLAVVHAKASVLHLSGICIRSNSRMRGILVDDSRLNFRECIVAGNRIGREFTETFGAGILGRRSRIHLQKSAIIGNVVDSAAGSGGGGGVYLEECEAEIAGTTIQANGVCASAEARGGGIWFANSKLRMWRSRVMDNSLVGGDTEGGGIYARNSQGQLGGSVITGNDSLHG